MHGSIRVYQDSAGEFVLYSGQARLSRARTTQQDPTEALLNNSL
jgi:hypothetical protein